MVYYFGCKFGILGETDGLEILLNDLNSVVCCFKLLIFSLFYSRIRGMADRSRRDCCVGSVRLNT